MKEEGVNKNSKIFLARVFRDVMKEELGFPQNTDMDWYMNHMKASGLDNVCPSRNVWRKNHRQLK